MNLSASESFRQQQCPHSSAWCTKLKSEGIVADGMIPKLTNSFKAIDKGVRKVIIKHARNVLNDKGTTLKKDE